MKKKTILSIMDSLEKINDSIIRNIDVGVQVSMEALADCQDSAIAVGNEIEQQYGADGEDIVHLLEVYCENLYQMSSKSEDLVSCRKLGKKIQKQLVQIRNHIKYDLPDDKKEVVFLPYKASMWDSLESVWKAADADPDCNAYVIPIPYFDKNPDGSFREEHYEGDLYPKDVPITRYDEYDLEARRPDVIYIHNPYDECNHVTSVHPYFYSKNLRNFTDKLVYIPYFVLGEIEPDNQAAIEGMKHFCFTPGTIYADQVIVQSENMRQIYINEYMKAAKEMGLGGEHVDRKFLEKKFLGTGSPKIDKVLNTKREDLEIPDKWLKVIEKPDGSWKKIVFYNTSVSALLQHSERMLKKMESVFEIFKGNKDEVALLWRPHPLIQATIESMRPQLWEDYQKIRDRYIEEGWGIYDDTSDVDRAVVISDAYYGDGSSVVQLYKKQRKVVLQQNVDCLREGDDQFFLCSYLCTFMQDYMVLISEATNALIQLSKKDWKIKSINTFTGQTYADSLYLSNFAVGNKVIAIPYNAKDFRVIDLLSGEQKEIEGCLTDDERNIYAKFYTTVVCGQHAWICGENIKRILGIDIETLTPFVNLAFTRIQGIEDIADKIIWSTGVVVKGNHFFLAGRNYGVILEINDLTNEAVVRTRIDVDGFSYFYEYGDQMLLIDQSGYEYQYDLEKNCIVTTGRKFDDACWKCIVIDKKRFYFEAFSGKILCIYDNDIREVHYGSRQDISRIGVKFQFVVQDGKYIYFQERFSGRIFALDADTDQCIQKEIDISGYTNEWTEKTIAQSEKEDADSYSENGFVSLESLLWHLNVE